MKTKATIYKKFFGTVLKYWMVVKGLNYELPEATALAFVAAKKAVLVTA